MIEFLEPRIAPATISFSGKSAQWTDHDGDIVKITWTVGNSPIFVTEDYGAGLVVQDIMLNSSHDGAKFAVTVIAKGGGDGHAELGRFNGTGLNITGMNAPKAGFLELDYGVAGKSVGALVIGGLGQVAPNDISNFPTGDGTSSISGVPTTVKVFGSIGYGSLEISAGSGKITDVLVKGSLRGTVFDSFTNADGFLSIGAGSIGKITITDSIIGGQEFGNGRLFISASVGSIFVGGSVIGGSEGLTGNVQIAGKLGSFTLGGNIVGGVVGGTGKVLLTNTTKITVGGSIVGGLTSDTGLLNAVSVGTLLIKGDILGGAAFDIGADLFTGGVRVSNDVGTLTVVGGLYAGRTISGTPLSLNGVIGVGGTVGKLTLGSVHGTSSQYAMILIGSTAAPSKPGDFTVLGSVNIKGSFDFGMISTGQGFTAANFRGDAENPDAAIGSITIGGNFQHSHILVGLDDIGVLGVDISNTRHLGDMARIARIGAVVIKGAITDGLATLSSWGIMAEKIASVTVGGVSIFKTGDTEHYLDSNLQGFIREF